MARRRPSIVRLLRAIWRYRSRIHEHGEQYEGELATAVRTALDERIVGRTALTSYRLAMHLVLGGAIAFGWIALVSLVLLWQLEPWLTLLALPPAVIAGVLAWWRISWGAPLDWLTEHADPTRTVAIDELPGRLRALAHESRAMANLPARLADELDALAAGLPAGAGTDASTIESSDEEVPASSHD